MRSFRPPKMFFAGFIFFVAILALALAAPWLSPNDPWRYAGPPLEAPSLKHPLGTNDVGQDLLSELLYGARTSLAIGLSVGLLASLISLGVGLSCALRGGWYDFALMRLIDAWLTVPPLLLVLLITAFLKPNTLILIVVLSLFSWAGGTRLIRAQGAEVKGELYVQAAQALGASSLYMMRRHLLPAVYPLLALIFLTQVRRAILLESALAFLGLADPTHKSWGVMIQYGFKFVALGDNWLWWLLPPSLALGLTLVSLALIVFGLESWFEPTLRH
jgi:peptide/nickel transport system permease protein